ncbi:MULTISPECIES: glucans biosynthesis glucosyltransferase MdoH [Edwardsiella]|uniref:Glucans biosynthesis glucosyltransferase H n=2 Tax=Edwardsiella anguillarum TaxID=1821960 RepID=A0A076LSB1_9GAMM|nr:MULTISPECIES: glucans biosynthesis glucosyltransferase MdoH [Edwardsiella]AKM48336.1 glucosyltransferase MdoH [Edwardsiella sp. EA181011]GAJ66438.1 glucans biosynthesis glucosyltransferase H [Edwardsiella piscicida]AIJ09527.1 Glucans biosynthesis glucosyltransferase H [Edwardsiella anguillarum ET080813]AKR77308.1 glucans biosynthesis glucosyltransferase MdoH [Edwardsiella sp. LADL05-105]KAB0592516.1 glucans biosynthesis glucosyltransferase MdoH [Edwardsiella anguillarum]
MNKSQENANAYLQALAPDAEQRAALDQHLSHPPRSVEDVHLSLAAADAGEGEGAEAALRSVAARLDLGWRDGEHQRAALVQDQAGHTAIKAMPTIRRTSMFPEIWRTNPFIRLWERLLGRTPPPKHTFQSHQEAEADKRWRRMGSLRRWVLLLLTFGQTAIATWYMKTILPYQGWDMVDPMSIFHGKPLMQYTLELLPYVLQFGILILFAILFCWVSAGFWTALMGFLQLLIGRDKYSISASTVGDEPIDPAHRTALIMPICNEDVSRVFAGLRATYESVVATGQLAHFDVFILSDSSDPDICVAEQKAWMELCQEVDGAGHIFYRRRRRRVKRKSGNIDDFCRRWGGNYSYMVILDADSVMSGECLTGLVRLMEANPTAGIIQTAPKATGMDTLYARVQQFATRVYGPLFTAGLHFWQLGESHYWGHNAIIRVKPFIEHCALAPLPGSGTFAGSILSHDFVEAALMRRAGWGVWIAYDLPGSYEELPPNLLDELKRDRRWCQGNLMNFRLFFVKGMHPVHRAVFLTGVMSYLSAPLWFLFLMLSTALQVVHTLMEPQYFLQPRQLFPVWPQWRPELAIALFSTTLVLLFLPKLLSVVLIWAKGSRQFGGPLRLLASMLLEMLFSVLLAPVRMIFHTVFVVSAFLGWSITWQSPQRDDDATPWSEAFRRHGSQMLLGLVWAGGMAVLDLRFLWWLSPIVVSLILSPFVSVITSRRTLGLQCKRAKLFLIPEEYQPPIEMAATERYVALNHQRLLDDGFMHALLDPLYNALACGMATARHRNHPLIARDRDARVAHALAESPRTLGKAERLTLLSDPVVMARLHQALWADPERYSQWHTAYRQLAPAYRLSTSA